MSGGRREQVIPSAARLVTSMRDVGYDFVTAIADLIDNSLSADATRVDVVIHPDGEESWIRVSDDGRGMAPDQITESLRFGSKTRGYTGEDLGKFGLGLKTASLSQARTLTVASRVDAPGAGIEARRLDLDDVVATDRWEIEDPVEGERHRALTETLLEAPGTVVLWTHLDRVLPNADPFATVTPRRLLNLAERLDTHLGMVFARFLNGQARRQTPLVITVNGTKVDPWDPFCRDQDVEKWPVEDLEVTGSMVRYRPYVLPTQKEFSDDTSWRAACGPRSWNNQQGLYVYRADRMIQSGGWSGLRVRDEHTKLARAALEFWPDLDETFEINIAKMRTRLPEALREQLKPLTATLAKAADERYRRGNRVPARPRVSPASRRPTSAPAPPAPAPPALPTQVLAPPPGVTPPLGAPVTAPAISVTTGAPPAGGRDAPGPRERLQALHRAAAQTGQQQALDTIAQQLKTNDPEVARDLGW